MDESRCFMKKIVVNALAGIDPNAQTVLFEAMRDCSPAERICVCLLFLSDLDGVPLSRVDHELRKIYPRVGRSGYTSEDYVGGLVNAIRTQTSCETKEVRAGRVAESDRLWCRLGHGVWANSPFGEALAWEVLARQGVLLVVRRPPCSDEVLAEHVSAFDELTANFLHSAGVMAEVLDRFDPGLGWEMIKGFLRKQIDQLGPAT
jgi:hypothetical protein